MKKVARLFGGAVLALAAVSASAVVQPSSPWSSLVIFGDSLSDTGNVLSLTQAFGQPAFPSFPGAEGRFSNGPVWTEHLAAGLGLPGDGAPSNLLYAGGSNILAIGAPGGQNYAYGGARTGLGGSAGATTGLMGQLVAWDGSASILAPNGALTRAADPNALYVVMAGANDLRDFRSGVANAPTPSTVAGNVVSALGLLANAGARNFMISTLPDLGLTPEAVGLGLTVRSTAATLAFNTALTQKAAAFDANFQQATGVDLNIGTLDFYGLVNQIVMDAAGGGNGVQFGITNISSACITPGPFSGQYYFADASAVNCGVAAFSDPLHPSARVHELVGNLGVQTAMAMAPVPEPAEFAMMIAGLLLIAGVRQRAKAKAAAMA